MNKQVSLLKRGIAFIIDLYLGALIATLPISLLSYITIQEMTQNVFLLKKTVAIIAIGLSLVLFIFYYLLVPLKLLQGQTLGKRLMDIKISYSHDQELIKRQMFYLLILTSFTTLIGELLSILTGFNVLEIVNDFTMSLSLVSVIMICFFKDHRGLYDRLAKTSLKNS